MKVIWGQHRYDKEKEEGLTDFEVEYVVGADCLAAVLEEFLDVDGDGQALKFAAASRHSGELAHPLRGVRCRSCNTRLSVNYCLLSSLITNQVSSILAGRRRNEHPLFLVAIMACCHGHHQIANLRYDRRLLF